MSQIEITNLSKSYGDKVVLDGIHLTIRKGEVVAIIGPSGSGKSTLLRCLNQLETIDSGTIRIDGLTYQAGDNHPDHIRQLRQKSAMVFQHFNLFKNKTAIENITLAPIANGQLTPSQARKRALDLLGKVGLLREKDQYPITLSGGQQQRVGIARALAVDPELILLDEPTSALDPELVGEVLTTIEKLTQSQKTIILVTHELSFAKKIANRIIFMEGGHIVEEGVPGKIFEHPVNQRTKEFLNKG